MSTLRDELQTICDHHGHLTPDIVVETARPKGHPLHTTVFNKDMREASEAYYRERAAELIRSVRVVYREATAEEAAGEVRAFQAVRSEDGYRYEPVEKVVQDPIARTILLREMEREWKQMRARYEHLQEFADLVSKDLAGAASQ